ncbi:MAG: hypothetical protein RIB59_17825 [Rhodospirillales bacterium]
MARFFTVALAFSALTALSACSGWQNVGGVGTGVVCNEEGEGVVWAKPNNRGDVKTLNLSRDNCYQ